jgi:hypothetical protein
MHNIILKHVEGLWIASFEDEPEAQGTGRSRIEAIGDLVMNNQQTFNMRVIEE